MREIKFRAWDKTLNDSLLVGNQKHFTLEELLDTDFFGVMQYTGLKDKGGLEIYDGDIIRFAERTINGGTFTHVCKVFQSENGAWRVEGYPNFKTDHKTRRELYVVRNFCEVIGNIYENPELLEETK